MKEFIAARKKMLHSIMCLDTPGKLAAKRGALYLMEMHISGLKKGQALVV